MIADLPMPSDRKRIFVVPPLILEVVAGAVSLSAATAGTRSEDSAIAAAESDKALIKKVRIGVRLPLLAILFVLLVIVVLLVTSQRERLGC